MLLKVRILTLSLLKILAIIVILDLRLHGNLEGHYSSMNTHNMPSGEMFYK